MPTMSLRSPPSDGRATTSSTTSRAVAMARISDVLDCDVVDADGRRVGRIRDVRLVMDGPVDGALARLRLDAVIVGGNALAGRLGYLRGGVQGPSLLKAVM